MNTDIQISSEKNIFVSSVKTQNVSIHYVLLYHSPIDNLRYIN